MYIDRIRINWDKVSREHQSPRYTTLWSDIPKTSVR